MMANERPEIQSKREAKHPRPTENKNRRAIKSKELESSTEREPETDEQGHFIV